MKEETEYNKMMSSIHIQTDDHQNEIDLSPTNHPSMDKSIFVKKSSTSALPSPQYTLETMSSWTSSSSPSSLALQSSLSALIQNKIDNDDNTNQHPSSSVDKSIFIKKSNSLPSPQYTLDTMSSWTSSGSPSSLALQSSLSIWPSSWLGGTVDEGDSKSTTADNKLPTSQENSDINTTKTTAVDELKKWVEDALVNNRKPQSYTTDSREEMCKDQYNNEVTTNRKAWVEETLLSTKPPQSYTTDARNEMCKDQNNIELTSNRKQWIESTLLSTGNDKSISSPVLKEEILNELQQLPSSVSKRREWLADVTHVKTSSELEDEVRHEFELAKMNQKKEEDEAAAEKKMLEEKEEEERVRVAYEKVAEATRVAEEEERIRNLFATAEMRIKKARQMEKESKKKRGLALQLNRQKKKTFSMAVNFDSSDSPVVNSKASLKRSRVDDNETIEEGGTKQVQVVGKKRKTLKVKKLVKRIVPKTMRK